MPANVSALWKLEIRSDPKFAQLLYFTYLEGPLRRSIVVANSAKLRFRLTAKTAHASLLLLSQSGPAVVDPLWVPFVGPRAAAHKRGKRNPRQTAGISAKSKNYSSMSMTTLFPRCGQSHESFAFAGTLLIEMLRAAKPPFRQGFVLRTKRLYAPYGAPHLRWGPEGGRTIPWQKEIPAGWRGSLKGVKITPRCR